MIANTPEEKEALANEICSKLIGKTVIFLDEVEEYWHSSIKSQMIATVVKAKYLPDEMCDYNDTGVVPIEFTFDMKNHIGYNKMILFSRDGSGYIYTDYDRGSWENLVELNIELFSSEPFGNDYMDFEEQHEGVFKVLQDDYRAPHLVVERHDSDFYLENGELKAKNDIKAGDVASIDLDIFNQWLDMSKIQ
jgi:hypothetical protein